MCENKNISALKQKLDNLALSNNSSLERAVALEVEGYSEEEIKCFFNDLLQYGCISGMVSSLIYYYQTEAFFDEHYHEIMELKTDFEEMTGQALELPYNLKNYLAWFSFEETARILWEAF